MENNQQLPTIPNQNPYDQLELIYRKAVDMKLERLKYRVIARQLNVKESTVKDWFHKKGICYSAYRWKEKQKIKESDELFKTIEKEIKDCAIEAFVTVRGAMRKGSVAAAFRILDMAGFEPVHRFKDETERSRELELLERIIDDNERTRKSLQGEQQTG
ncbi:MAG: hypothetical protein M3Q44_07395 [bacterium]|nr:hypothetical protein [bacterium]